MKRKIPSNYKEEIINLYHNGLKPLDISKKLGLKPPSVNAFFQSKNITFLPKQGNVKYFKNIDSHIKAYILGFIAADGALVNNGNGSYVLTISIHKKDISILEKIKSEIGFKHNIQFLDNNLVRIAISNPKLTKHLFTLGIIPNKSKKLSNIIENVNSPFKQSFIIGYFDGDGSVSKMITEKYVNKIKEYNYYTSLVVQIRSTKKLLEGIKDTLSLNQYNISKYDSTYRLTFGKKSEVKKLFNCYKNLDFYLERKFKIFLNLFDQAQTISST